MGSFSFDRTVDPPWGLAGGEAGRPGSALVREPGDEEWKSYNKVSNIPLPTGTLIKIVNGGGGGWGPPVDIAAPPADRRRDGI
jgi:N-methylhydantoinase B/oxoprolinase/acetone carboxylase alpha subunit